MKKAKFLVLGWMLLIAAVFLTLVDVCCFDRSFYVKEYEKNGPAEVIGISDEQLIMVTEHLLGYLEDTEEVLKIDAEIGGVVRNVFDERDTMHMVDVKVLYQNAMLVRNVTLILALVIFGYNISHMKQDVVASFAVSFYKALGAFMMICVAVLIGAAVDFDAMWRFFHTIFFSNDLWLLDPNVSVLINMVPLQFFFDLVTKVVVLFIAFLAVCSTIFLFVVRKVVAS